MYKQEIVVDLNTDGNDFAVCVVSSKDATRQFKLHQYDIEFIQECVYNDNQKSGSCDVIVDEGLINVEWQLKQSE